MMLVMPKVAASTSWERVSPWYKRHLSHGDTLQRSVVIPGVLELLADVTGGEHLDIACGEGTFAEAFTEAFPHRVFVGIDAAPTLISYAKRKRLPKTTFFVDDARVLQTVSAKRFTSASCILALQNIDAPHEVFARASRILASNAPFVLVLNHPHYRQPKQSSWGWDQDHRVQYRRIDRYLTPYVAPIVAHPGKDTALATPSFHWPLSDLVRMASSAGLLVEALDEWISPAVSDSGPRAKAENMARQEIPLFLGMVVRKIA